MDPIEVIELCLKAAEQGAPHRQFRVPRIFNAGYYQDMWNREPKRVRAVLDRLMCADHAGDGLEMLLRFNVLASLFPEVSAMKGMGDDPEAALHKDVWAHTKAVVMGVPPELDLRWGALMHDIGKVKTRRVIKGHVSFHNHDRVGARLVDALNDRTKLFQNDVALLRTVRYLVLEHLRPVGYNADWTDSAVRRLITECGDTRFFEKLMLLSRADLTTKNPRKRERALGRAQELEQRVAHILELDAAPKLPKGTMGLIIAGTDEPPGPWTRTLRDRLEVMMATGQLPTDGNASFYAEAGLELLRQVLNEDVTR